MVAYIEELTTSRFCIDIDNLQVAIFQECSGLNGEIQVETYQEGGLNDYEHKFPGRTKHGNVTLKSGVAASTDLWDWFYDISMGKIERREVSIVMYLQDRRGGTQGENMRWTLHQAFPVRWEGPSFNAGDNAVAVHSLELAHHGLEKSSR